MADLGTDGSTFDGDLDDRLSLDSGRRLLIADVYARLEESPGGLWYSPDYGGGLLDELNESYTSESDYIRLQNRLASQCLLDQRVESAEVTVAKNGARGLKVSVRIDDGDGPFTLVIGLDQTTGAELLEVLG